MKFYELDTELTFGKHKGLTILEAVEKDSSYIEWCILNLDHFYIELETIAKIQETIHGFNLSEIATEMLARKYEKWESEINDNEPEDFHENDDYNNTFGEYEGSYAQEIEGLSDDFIDDVLDGDPDNYWNID